MSIRTKLVLVMLLVAVLPLVFIGIWYVNNLEDDLTHKIGRDHEILAQERAAFVAELLNRRIQQAKNLSSHPEIIHALLGANSRSKGIGLEAITRIDREWLATKGNTVVADTILSNHLSRLFKGIKEQNHKEYGELFATDRNGLTVAMSNILTDYYQADELWWKRAYNDGNGLLYIDDQGVDLSVGDLVAGVAAPVMNEGELLGILKVNFLMRDLIPITVSPYKNSRVKIYLMRADGGVVTDSGQSAPNLPVQVQTAMQRGDPSDWYIDLHGQQQITGIARVKSSHPIFTRDSQQHRLPTDWYVVVNHPTHDALKLVDHVRYRAQLALGLALLLISLIIALVVSIFLRPLQQLRKGMDRIREGNLEHRVNLNSNDELGALAATFNQMLDSLDSAQSRAESAQALSRAKDDFLATMSHELRTPLTSIIGNSEYLLELECSSEMHSVAHDIEIAGRNQLALVNDILDMSKIESGKFTINESPFVLRRVLDEIEGLLKLRAQDAGVELIVEQRVQEKYKLMGDAHRIGQILVNLVGNAIKFTEKGEVRLSVSRSDSGRLLFEVKDTGIGMTPQEQSKLFKKFEQADGSISRRFGGSGLGLYISFNLAQMMDGSITASSIKGQGSTFTLDVPYRESDEMVSIAADDERAVATDIDERVSGMVLVVEDLPALQLLERRILEGMGLTVTTADNGVQAVNLARTQPFDLILMDMQMPEMDGIEATTILRKEGINTPVVALTANVMQKHRDQFVEAGCNDFLEKPIDKEKLRVVVNMFLH